MKEEEGYWRSFGKLRMTDGEPSETGVKNWNGW
jgi:hypothetical protein